MRKGFVIATALVLQAVSCPGKSPWDSGLEVGASGILTYSYSATADEHNFRPAALLRASARPFKGMTIIGAYNLKSMELSRVEACYDNNGRWSAQAGLLKSIYLYEMGYSIRKMEMSGYSLAASYLGAWSEDVSGIQSKGKEWGILINRNCPAINTRLSAGLFNGSGTSIIDDNKAKDIQERLVCKPTGSLTLAQGMLLGKYNDADGFPARRDRFSLAVWYDNKSQFLRTENIYGLTGDQRSNSYYIMGGFRFNRNTMSIATRFDHYLADLTDLADNRKRIQLCFTDTVDSLGLIFKLQIGHVFRSSSGIASDNTIQLNIFIS